MIFLTVGTQLPFDRLVKAVDAWCADHPDVKVFAQIGPTSFVPAHLVWKKFIDPVEFQRQVEQCSIIVAHAGMGSILSAIELRRPVIVMPRLASLNEHRNDHQASTARRLADLGIHVAKTTSELVDLLDRRETLSPPNGGSPERCAALTTAVRTFIEGGNPLSVLTNKMSSERP